MKKSLLVLAVAAAVPALAQAQTNVTLYGRVDTSVAFENRGTGGGSAVLLQQGIQSSNRWGVRGSEDLGGGLKAVFNLEGGFQSDDGLGPSGGGLNFQRRSVVGVEGGFGTFVMGRDYNPLFRVLLAADTLGLGHYNNVHTIVGATGAFGVNQPRTYGVRMNNGLHYVSPSFGGFVIRAAYGFSEQFLTSATVPTKSVGRAIGLAAEYNAGPLYVGLAYQGNTVAIGGSDGTDKFTSLGARYNFGAFAVNGGYARNDLAGNSATVLDSKSIWIGADAQVGPGRLHAQFANIDPTGAGKASSIGITYNYPLSKRTNAYATFGQMRNNSATNYALTTSSTAVTAGALGSDPRGIAFGIGHNF